MTPHRINMRMKDRPARVNAYDRRIAAIHEAGHVLMALHLGYQADAWIHQHKTSRPLEEKTWVGHMVLHDRPEDLRHPDVRMIAVAGLVAEILWKTGHDEEYADQWGWECYLLDEDSMSPSDWRLAGCEPGDPDDNLFQTTAEVAKLFLTDLWPDLVGISRTLMSDTEAIHSFSYGSTAARAA